MSSRRKRNAGTGTTNKEKETNMQGIKKLDKSAVANLKKSSESVKEAEATYNAILAARKADEERILAEAKEVVAGIDARQKEAQAIVDACRNERAEVAAFLKDLDIRAGKLSVPSRKREANSETGTGTTDDSERTRIKAHMLETDGIVFTLSAPCRRTGKTMTREYGTDGQSYYSINPETGKRKDASSISSVSSGRGYHESEDVTYVFVTLAGKQETFPSVVASNPDALVYEQQ